MSDARTPTYDDLSALCAQMAAALNAWMVFSNADDPAYKARWEVRGRVDTIAALAAYRTLSPDPVYAEAKNLRDALQNMLGVYDTPLSRRRFPPDDFMNEAINTARETANRARGGG